MRGKWYVAVGFLAMILGPTQGWTQFPPSRGGDYGRRGSSSYSTDPNQFFDRLANGKEVWVRSDITNPFMQGMFDRIVERLGITNGQITREQFATYSQQRAAERAGGVAPPPPTTPAGSTTAPPPAAGTPAPAPGGTSADSWNRWVEERFRRYDVNGDGLLNYDEMPDSLRAERDKWDANRDGFIDLNEYRAYYQARTQQRMAESGTAAPFGQAIPVDPSGLPITTPVEEEEKKPVVYRSGKLPKELPGWFKQMDEDNDGQIGLYEWKASGRSLEEFQRMDRNNDGFLTIEEVLRYTAQNKSNSNQQVADAGAGNENGPAANNAPSSSSGSRRSFGGGPPSMGKGPPRSGSDGGSSRGSYKGRSGSSR